MAADKKPSQFLLIVFSIFVVMQAIALLSDTKGCEATVEVEAPILDNKDEESQRIREELAAKYAKNNPPPMIDPFTGNLIAKATTVRAVQKAIERGEDKGENGNGKLIVCHDFCGDGKKACGVWTEINALKKAQEDMQSVLGPKACLHITSSCRTNKYQYKIWRKYWVIGKDGKPELKDNGDPVTAIVVGKPGYSFHEACRAFDVANYDQAETYLWKQGFSGGSRGLPKDAVHFSRGGEFTNAERISIQNIANTAAKYGKKGLEAGKKGAKAVGKLIRNLL